MANLPYDTEVEYLESTGTQWINSGVISENAVAYEVKFKLGPTYTGGGIFGSLVKNIKTTNNRVLRYNAGNTIIVQRGSYSTTNSIPIDYDWHTVSSSSSQMAIDSTTFSSGSCTNGGAIIALFASGDVGTALGAGSVLISYARIWTSNTLVRDFIPVRFTNENGISEGAMYDKVSGQMFRNSGTGSFIIGPDVAIIEKNHGKLNLGKVEVPELLDRGGVWLGKNPVKQVWLGKNLVWERLPYDAEIEWIRAYRTSGDMLDTGIVVDDNNWMFEADCAIDQAWVNWRGPFTAYTNETTQCTRVIIYYTDLTKVLVGYRQKGGGGNNTITPGNGWTWAKRSKHRVSYMKYELTPYGEATRTYTLNAPSGTASPSTQRMVLQFKDVICTIYGFKAWHNNVLVMDLIPVRVGSEPMFYDKVGKKLMPLTSATDGHVTAGADLNPTGERRTPIETNGYAQDGLIAMWDAKENAGVGLHTQQMSVWKNLGSLGSEYDFIDPFRVHWSNDCLVTEAANAQMTSPMIPRDSIKTMEVYFKTIYGGNITADNSRFRPFVFGDRLTNGQWQMTRRCVEWDVNDGKRGWMFGTGNALPSGQTGTSVPLGLHHFSVVYPAAADTVFATGDQPVRILRDGSVWNVTSWLNEGDAIQQKQSIGTAYDIGGQYISGTGTVEKIYCIRLYNRQLTLEEQQANYALDVQRYG